MANIQTVSKKKSLNNPHFHFSGFIHFNGHKMYGFKNNDILNNSSTLSY